jgi:hypothetical protein
LAPPPSPSSRCEVPVIQAAEKPVGGVILSIDSLSAAHDEQKLDEETPSPKLSS